jgi:metal-responsive CopG/Arc/MetJ family transcriptional regulator
MARTKAAASPKATPPKSFQVMMRLNAADLEIMDRIVERYGLTSRADALRIAIRMTIEAIEGSCPKCRTSKAGTKP